MARNPKGPTLSVVGGAGLLFVLLFASAGSSSREQTAPEDVAAAVPWAPLSMPPEGTEEIRAALSLQTSKERLEALAGIYDDSARSETSRGLASFAAGALLTKSQRSAEAVSRLRAPVLDATELAAYGLYFAAQELESRPGEALELLEELESKSPDFLLLDESRLTRARMLRERGRNDEAIEILRSIVERRDVEEKTRGEALSELGSALSDEKRYADAVVVLETLYYEIPRHPRAASAGQRLNVVRSRLPPPEPMRLYTLGMRRAEILMGQGRYADAYQTFSSLIAPSSKASSVVDRDLVQLKMGVCLYERRQLSAALTALTKVRRADLEPESMFYRAETARRLRNRAAFIQRAEELIERYPRSAWSEEALHSLAQYHEERDEKDEALAYYRRVVAQFPDGKYFLDAQWRVLWDSFKAGKFAEAAFGWEEAARKRPGGESVSKFLYWAGRGWQEAGRFDRAEPIYRQVLLGYQNTYYGRRALEHLSEIEGHKVSLANIEAARSGIDLSEALRVERVHVQMRIAQLYAVGLEKEALQEAMKAVRGLRDDTAFLAIAAWIHADRERNLDAFRTLRDAFPFHVSATGDLLPRPVWELFFPLAYWETVQRYSEERGLDPYLVAALIRQESTFNPRVRSHAGARGLMQIIPSTGQILARQEKRRYDAAELYNPEINIRYGTRYLKDVLESFGGRVDYALASYNAGPHRVKRWTGMDLTIPSEIFIEEIPFDETRDYVKLVLRNEMLYRRLYATSPLAAAE
jgi:soluble lytic murein transglycosylase